MEFAAEAINSVIDIAAYQRKIERRNVLITIISFVTVIMLVFLIDTMQWIGFIMVCLPIIMIGIGTYLIGLSIHRRKKKSAYSITLILGILALLFPIFVFLLLCFAFVLGGPVPT